MIRIAVAYDQLFREVGHIYYEFKSTSIEKVLCGQLAAQYPDSTLISVSLEEETKVGTIMTWIKDYDCSKVVKYANTTL